MSIEIAAAIKKCNNCRNRRAQRYCLRKGKDICWDCCNGFRIDLKCPKECPYILQDNDLIKTPLSAKVESITEHREMLKKYFDVWIHLPEAQFGNISPIEFAQTEAGKNQLLEMFGAAQSFLPLDYFYQRLGIKTKVPAPFTSYEDTAIDYLKKAAAIEWEDSITLLINNSRYQKPEYLNSYISRRKSSPLLNKINSFDLIASGVSAEYQEAFAYFDINYGNDLTVLMENETQESVNPVEAVWKVKSILLGSPVDYYGENKVLEKIYTLISKNDFDEAAKKIAMHSKVYVDSAEICYLSGILSSLKNDYKKANQLFLNAIEIEPDFYDAEYNLAFTFQALQDSKSAQAIYEQLREKNPEDVKVLNNLAAIYMAEGRLAEAKDLLDKCLEIAPDFEPAQKNAERIVEKNE